MSFKKMKKLICLFVAVMLLGGCSFFRGPRKFSSGGPQETAEFRDFKGTPKDDAKLFQTMGLGFFKQKDWVRSQDCFAKAVKLDPKLYWSWCYLGLLNIDSREGYDYLKKSEEAKPDFPIPYYWMAYYHCRLRQDQKAIASFKKYIELAKGNPDETERLQAAEEALRELQSGKDGEILAEIRKPSVK